MGARKILRKFLFCDTYDIRRTILLTSSPRSGSTWLAQAWHELGFDLLDEPINPHTFPEEKRIGFEWRTYIDPNAFDPARLAFMRHILSGDKGYVLPSRDLFGIAPTPRFLKHCRLIVKCVRANRMLSWITSNFPTEVSRF